MTSHISAELVRRCHERRLCSATTQVCAVLGEAVDAGVVELGELLALVRSCATADELGDRLAELAGIITVAHAVPSGVFRIVGEREVWTGGKW